MVTTSRTSSPAEQITGFPDSVYDLILVLQQALEDAVRYAGCASDARGANDEGLVAFFSELSDSDKDMAARAGRMLADRLRR